MDNRWQSRITNNVIDVDIFTNTGLDWRIKMEQEGIVALVCFAVGALFGFVIGCERTQNLEAQKRRDQARSQA